MYVVFLLLKNCTSINKWFFSNRLHQLKIILQWKLGEGEHYNQNNAVFRGTLRRFPPKDIKTLFRLSRVLLDLWELHSKRRYKIWTCSVILGELESFRDYKGFSIILPKILDAM